MSAPETSASSLMLAAQGSPAGFAWVTNLPISTWHEREEEVALRSNFWLPPHIMYLDEMLVKLVSRQLLREGYQGLIVTMPPRHGKSELVSHYLPAWYMGAFPQHWFALASYESTFAATWGRKARDTFEEWTTKFFDVEVDKRSQAAERWGVRQAQQYGLRSQRLMSAGGMYTAGVGGPMTGRGANVLVIDDPIKNAAEALSRVKRDAIWNWYTSTARSRLEPGGVILVVMTRWHEDDLVGRLLAAQGDSSQGTDHALYDPGADKFLVINFPAIAEENDALGRVVGDPLWEKRYGVTVLKQIRATVGARVWEALYQQRPSPLEGALFNRDWFPIVDEMPKGIPIKKRVRVWDLAASEVGDYANPDYTVGVRMALTRQDERNVYYVEDVSRFRRSAADTETSVAAVARDDGQGLRVRLEQEPGSSGKSQVDHYKRNVLKGHTVRGERATGTKELRAEAYSAAAERGDVRLLRRPWLEEFLSEHEQFPFGAHDDQVDAAANAMEELAMSPGAGTSW